MDLANGPGERHFASHHEIERGAKRIDVRANVQIAFLHLFRASEVRCADESSHSECARVFTCIFCGLRQSKIDDFDDRVAFFVD